MNVAEALSWLLFAVWLASLLLHLGSVAAAASQASFRRRRAAPPGPQPPVSVLAPTREPEPSFAERVRELASLRYPRYELIISSERADPTVEAALAALTPAQRARVRRVVDGARHTPNAKVNVLIDAYRSASYEIILLTDDNVCSPPDRIESLVPHLHGRTGLVSSVAVGTDPANFAAEVEASFMNGYGSRFLLAADRIGRSFAMGKTLLFRRGDLDRAGGVARLSEGMAMDSVIRERLGAVGLATALAPVHAQQPLGRRSFAAVFARQLRWIAARRWHAPLAFWTEPVHGALFCGLAGGFAAELMLGGGFVAGLAVTWLVWLGLDLAITRRLGWPVFPRYPLAWAVRELLVPVIWGLALVKRSVLWRGNEVPLRPRVPAAVRD